MKGAVAWILLLPVGYQPLERQAEGAVPGRISPPTYTHRSSSQVSVLRGLHGLAPRPVVTEAEQWMLAPTFVVGAGHDTVQTDCWGLTSTPRIHMRDNHFSSVLLYVHSLQTSGTVCYSRWPSWAFRPNEPYGFCGRKAVLNHASALATVCP